jgi:hypothetical protein
MTTSCRFQRTKHSVRVRTGCFLLDLVKLLFVSIEYVFG